MNFRLSSLAALVATLMLAPSPASARDDKASAADFGVGAVACSIALTQKGFDLDALKADGWSKARQNGLATVYDHGDAKVSLFLSKAFAPSGQCVVDGYAETGVDFAAIRDAVKLALAAKCGDALSVPDPVSPNGQAFVCGSLMQYSVPKIVRKG